MRALCDFAILITRTPAGVTERHIDDLRAHGCSDTAIHDAIQVVSFFNYINRVADGVGIDAEPDWEADGSRP